MSFKRTLGALITTVAIGLAGCQTAEAVKPVEPPLPSRMVDVDKDGKLERVYVEKIYNLASKKNEYELRVEETDNDGRKSVKVISYYGTMDPRTRNFLVFFYHRIDEVIAGRVR